MNESKGLKYYLSVFIKGMGMGAADVVPGVSGGTVAFITGIYQDLLDSIISGVRSAFTYAGAGDIATFHERAVIGIQSAAGYAEGRPLHTSW